MPRWLPERDRSSTERSNHVSSAVVDGAMVTYAHFGADEHTQYEIGSLTKTFTALLLADAIGAARSRPTRKSAHCYRSTVPRSPT
jgi:hypothetical protein